MTRKVLGVELGDVINGIHKFGGPSYNPKILYVLVNKRISHRIFESADPHREAPNEFINPGPGTVLDMGVVEDDGNAKDE